MYRIYHKYIYINFDINNHKYFLINLLRLIVKTNADTYMHLHKYLL